MQPPETAALVCGTSVICQHYALTKLLFAAGKVRDFAGVSAMILPTSLWTASVLVQDGETGIFSPLPSSQFSGLGEVKEIQYTLTVWDQADAVQEHFRHPVKHRVDLGSSGLIRKGKVKLFMQMPLNRILDTTKFPNMKGLQFIC